MRVPLADELAKLPRPANAQWPGGVPFTSAFAHGTMRLVVFAPSGQDVQEPHEQDEVYFVISGTGTLIVDGERFAFVPGDALFVGARQEHRFVEFSDDLVTWAVFWGPKGGES